MEYRQLGHDGPHVTRLTFGAWPIGGGLGAVDDAAAVATIHRALDLGVTAIDTAEGYRASEAILGRALRGRPRDRVFLATKVSREPFTRERVREALDNSLRALETGHVDLYQLHRYPSDVPLEEAIGAMAGAQASGRARYVGVSNFTVDQLAAARRLHPIQSVQPRLSIFDSEAARDLLSYCARENVGVIVHSPLAKGLLTGKYRPGHVFAPDDERSGFPRFRGEAFARYLATADELAAIAQAKGATLVQLAIAWTLVQPGVTSCIVGAKTPEQVEEQISGVALRQRLDEGDLRRIGEIADGLAGAG
jgi:aryl-alcohol dehydrogenase-like predicted oxidoreductase